MVSGCRAGQESVEGGEGGQPEGQGGGGWLVVEDQVVVLLQDLNLDLDLD